MYTAHAYCLRTRAVSTQHCTKIKSVWKVEFWLCTKMFPSEHFLLYSKCMLWLVKYWLQKDSWCHIICPTGIASHNELPSCPKHITIFFHWIPQYHQMLHSGAGGILDGSGGGAKVTPPTKGLGIIVTPVCRYIGEKKHVHPRGKHRLCKR